MSEQKPVPTMKDVAREAGVALGTVSKVVNGLPVGEEYRVRVEKAIKKLDYRVNSYAKGLRSNKTFLVAVVMPNLVNPFFVKLVSCINKALAARAYRMLFYATDFDPQQEQEVVLLAEQQKVDGIICLSYNPDLKIPANIPLISIDRYFGSLISCVSSDNYGGGRLAAEKLVENGCKNLAFLRIGSKLTNEPNKRKDGFASALVMLAAGVIRAPASRVCTTSSCGGTASGLVAAYVPAPALDGIPGSLPQCVVYPVPGAVYPLLPDGRSLSYRGA